MYKGTESKDIRFDEIESKIRNRIYQVMVTKFLYEHEIHKVELTRMNYHNEKFGTDASETQYFIVFDNERRSHLVVDSSYSFKTNRTTWRCIYLDFGTHGNAKKPTSRPVKLPPYNKSFDIFN